MRGETPSWAEARVGDGGGPVSAWGPPLAARRMPLGPSSRPPQPAQAPGLFGLHGRADPPGLHPRPIPSFCPTLGAWGSTQPHSTQHRSALGSPKEKSPARPSRTHSAQQPCPRMMTGAQPPLTPDTSGRLGNCSILLQLSSVPLVRGLSELFAKHLPLKSKERGLEK